MKIWLTPDHVSTYESANLDSETGYRLALEELNRCAVDLEPVSNK
jgi:hypothetical protein